MRHGYRRPEAIKVARRAVREAFVTCLTCGEVKPSSVVTCPKVTK